METTAGRMLRMCSGREGRVGDASGLHPTLHEGAKDGAPELLGSFKGGHLPGCLVSIGSCGALDSVLQGSSVCLCVEEQDQRSLSNSGFRMRPHIDVGEGDFFRPRTERDPIIRKDSESSGPEPRGSVLCFL